MYEYLVIRLRGGNVCTDTIVDWMFISLQGEPSEARADSLREVGERYGALGQKPVVVVLAPARNVLLSAAEVPVGQHRYAKQAMPFLVEEKLAEDIEDVHIAIGPVFKTEPVPVAVVRHFDVINWLDALYSVGLPTAWLVPEQLAAPWQPGRVTVYLEEQCSLIRDGAWHGLGCDVENTELAVSLVAQQCRGATPTSLPQIDLAYSETPEARAAAERLRSSLQDRVGNPIKLVGYRESALEVLARTQVKALGDSINLLQGGYASKSVGFWGGFSAMRVAGTFAACAVLHLVLTLGAGLWFDWRAATLKADGRALYSEWFPQAQRVFNPRRQLQSKLASSDGAGSELLLSYIGAVANDWQAEGNLKLQAIEYDGQARSMSLQLQSAAAEQMGNLQQQLQARGFPAKLQSVAQRGDSVTGRLKLGGMP
jgi:general secretion pathway protein L